MLFSTACGSIARVGVADGARVGGGEGVAEAVGLTMAVGGSAVGVDRAAIPAGGDVQAINGTATLIRVATARHLIGFPCTCSSKNLAPRSA
jgi:hypothetical protein